MRDHVEGDLLGELRRRLFLTRHIHALGLIPQLVHALLAGAGHRLVGAHHHPLDRRAVMQGLERHHHLRGRAIGVGDDVFLGIAVNCLRVHFRHDQRNIRVVAVERRVVDHGAPGLGGLGCVLLCRLRADGEQRHIPAGEIESVEILGLESGVAKADFGAQRTAARQRGDLVDGKLALGQDVQHFAAHVARGADDNDSVAHWGLLYMSLVRPVALIPQTPRLRKGALNSVDLVPTCCDEGASLWWPREPSPQMWMKSARHGAIPRRS